MRISIAKVSDMPLGDIWQGLQTVFADAHMRIAPPKVLLAQMEGQGPDLVVLPGISGEASPYPKLFDQQDRAVIAEYLNRGGKALGICAGAYFLAENALYDFGNKNRFDKRDSMTGVFKGAAAGPLRAGPNDRFVAVNGHAAGEVWTVATHYTGTDTTLHSPYGRGPAFYPHFDNTQNVEVLARYVDQPRAPAAAIAAQIGEGRVVLTGILPYMQRDCAEHVAAWDSMVAPLRKSGNMALAA